jgi:hypothetical protein
MVKSGLVVLKPNLSVISGNIITIFGKFGSVLKQNLNAGLSIKRNATVLLLMLPIPIC